MIVRGNAHGHRGCQFLVLVSSALPGCLTSAACAGVFVIRHAGVDNNFICAGENSVIKRAIIDDNVSIGRNVKITNKDNVDEADSTKQGWVIQNGIVVVLKGAVIPDGTEI